MKRWIPLLAAGVLACSGNGEEKDAAAADLHQCKQPPNITYCDPPPNAYSTDKYFCRCVGQYCGGGSRSTACNGSTNDCRFFYDDCIPASYTRCDQNANDRIFGLCGMCFFTEAGVVTKPPKICDKLTVDSGPSKPDVSRD